jgi:hypothetical protein
LALVTSLSSRAEEIAVQLTSTRHLNMSSLSCSKSDRDCFLGTYSAFAFSIDGDLFSERVTKARENGNKQIDFGQGSSTLSLSAQEEFNLDSAPAIGNGKHVVAPPVFALVGGFNLGEDMRCKTG